MSDFFLSILPNLSNIYYLFINQSKHVQIYQTHLENNTGTRQARSICWTEPTFAIKSFMTVRLQRQLFKIGQQIGRNILPSKLLVKASTHLKSLLVSTGQLAMVKVTKRMLNVRKMIREADIPEAIIEIYFQLSMKFQDRQIVSFKKKKRSFKIEVLFQRVLVKKNERVYI